MLSSSNNSMKLTSHDSKNSAAEKRKNRPLPEIPHVVITQRPMEDPRSLMCCRYSRLILGIGLSVLVLSALGVAIYLIVPKGCCTTPPVTKNLEILDLLHESLGQNVTILQNVSLNFTTRIWSLEGREISINISNSDNLSHQLIILSVSITNSQCRHAGKYFVVMYNSNGRAEKSISYNVKAPCPCDAEYELNSGRVFACELKVIGSTTLRFDKVSDTNITPILYQTGIRIPDNVPERNRFSASWRSDGTLITRINFSPVQCHDEGNYSLTVTSQAGEKVYYIYVKVIDQPENPTLSIPKGLINGKEVKLQCHASSGCSKANLTIESTEPNSQVYMPWGKQLTQNYYQESGIWKTNVTLILTSFEVNINLLQNKRVRCTYSIDGRNYYSQPICMKVIPDNFCNNKSSNCNYPHPYDCNKYITCTTVPVEMTCQSGLHFLYSASCKGSCVNPNEAKCNVGQ
ncbi:hypothetical protein CHS0354_007181 [Potamilus streckersoni]|uniref:Uncharacterized protein n=1 Tax=Potamilus streckersoni TaxID=2493646 RepID=A0AAE0T702_9BIVA|nr:hypothetical protein CHS0354_007181 [Potamilus streckersoni]